MVRSYLQLPGNESTRIVQTDLFGVAMRYGPGIPCAVTHLKRTTKLWLRIEQLDLRLDAAAGAGDRNTLFMLSMSIARPRG
jgi:hypothetical protein